MYAEPASLLYVKLVPFVLKQNASFEVDVIVPLPNANLIFPYPVEAIPLCVLTSFPILILNCIDTVPHTGLNVKAALG